MCCACLTWSLAAPGLSGGEAARELESRVKAAYLFNFLKFVDYPANGQAWSEARTICTFASDPIGPALEEGAKVHAGSGHPVHIRRIATTAQAQGCHVLYLAASGQRSARAVIEQIQNSPILTVSEGPDFLDLGGIVLLYIDAGRLQFEINAEAAKRAGLRISSKLMVLSRSSR